MFFNKKCVEETNCPSIDKIASGIIPLFIKEDIDVSVEITKYKFLLFKSSFFVLSKDGPAATITAVLSKGIFILEKSFLFCENNFRFDLFKDDMLDFGMEFIETASKHPELASKASCLFFYGNNQSAINFKNMLKYY